MVAFVQRVIRRRRPNPSRCKWTTARSGFWRPRREWNTTYLAELTMFPKGKHDDQVDSSVIAFNEVALGVRRGFKRVKVRGMH